MDSPRRSADEIFPAIVQKLSQSNDFKRKTIMIGDRFPAEILYFEGVVDSADIADFVVRPLAGRRFLRLRTLAQVRQALDTGGAFLLATHGDPSQLALSPQALVWCVLAAISIAIYSVQPRAIIAEYGTLPVTGFGMLIGGLGLCGIFQPWHVAGRWDAVTVTSMAYIIVFGTICAFCCYLEGVRRIGAAKGSILAAVEPVASAVLSVVWLGVPLGGMDFGGMALIVAAMVLLSGDDGDKPNQRTCKNREKACLDAKKD